MAGASLKSISSFTKPMGWRHSGGQNGNFPNRRLFFPPGPKLRAVPSMHADGHVILTLVGVAH